VRLSEEIMVANTRWTLATHQYALKFMPARRPLRSFVEADVETRPEERRRFAIINIPRHLFSEATGQAARRRAESSR
jgi:hypothetical protein